MEQQEQQFQITRLAKAHSRLSCRQGRCRAVICRQTRLMPGNLFSRQTSAGSDGREMDRQVVQSTARRNLGEGLEDFVTKACHAGLFGTLATRFRPFPQLLPSNLKVASTIGRNMKKTPLGMSSYFLLLPLSPSRPVWRSIAGK